ncbi:putative O-sialoglycoprotein endopeptidase [Trichinella spiralis]|uniref:putative O-sialoglycoprotein endopeptidase n=1 Tax=Trichinella spiralis TaxID=6334 RepID=UPI0001EFDBA6|nr:putative O-sialoglycoprotein endopeptidase [Trichinella spiralis]
MNRPLILGIETSCDDTGAAVVDGFGNILGEELSSQQSYSSRFGGVIPTFAKRQHLANVEAVVNGALTKSGITLQNLDAIAVTNKPGMPVCLRVGVDYATNLCRISSLICTGNLNSRKPLIPVHHMAAHAFVVRLAEPRVQFPFLCLLMSGGHCILLLVKSVRDFLTLGNSLDIAPGEAFDKVARRLQLYHVEAVDEHLSGGMLVQKYARGGDRCSFEFPQPLRRRDCNFSFTGLTSAAVRHIEKLESSRAGISSLFQFDKMYNCWPTSAPASNMLCFVTSPNDCSGHFNTLLTGRCCKPTVISGGVASNDYFRSGFQFICSNSGYELRCPPPELCTDNGTMIAWYGAEKYNIGYEVLHNLPDQIPISARDPLGEDVSNDISELRIAPSRMKFNF